MVEDKRNEGEKIHIGKPWTSLKSHVFNPRDSLRYDYLLRFTVMAHLFFPKSSIQSQPFQSGHRIMEGSPFSEGLLLVINQ